MNNFPAISTTQKGAVLAALYLALRFYYRKSETAKAKGQRKLKDNMGLVTDFGEVACKVGEYRRDEFDVVVVGGGTAGCVVAARLSEDPSIRVLLLEAGRSGRGLAPAEIPCSYSEFWLGPHEWGLHTEEQANGKKYFWPRAKLLGGCTNMNAMMFHHGAPTDFDDWAALQKGQPGAEGWTHQEFNKYFLKFEKYSPSKKFPDVDVSLRNVEGHVDIGFHSHFAISTAKWIEACSNVGIARTHDLNTPKGTMGVSKIMTYISSNGKRATAETSYLTPEVLARPNLKVLTNAAAHRVLFDTSSDTPRAVGVEFASSRGSDTKFSVKALKEVVVCAGAVHTPHILMHSGVGPAEHLKSVGVPVVKDLPGVGSHLKDHAVVDLNYLDKTHTSLNYLRPSTLGQRLQMTKAVMQYLLFKTGPLTTNLAEAAAFVHSHDTALYPPQLFPPATLPADTASGEGAPDIEIFVTATTYSDHGLGPNPIPDGMYGFATHAVCLRPQSTGTIRLRSSVPTDPPIIDPRILSDPNDVKVLIRGVRLLDRIAHTEPFAAMIDPAGATIHTLTHDLSKLSDAQLEAYVREKVQTLYHPACTARMAPLEDGGVVDPFLRVHGIKGLRVADASVFPEINAGHTTAPVYAVGEKAADMIKAEIGAAGK